MHSRRDEPDRAEEADVSRSCAAPPPPAAHLGHSGERHGGLLSADLPRVTIAGEEGLVGEGLVELHHHHRSTSGHAEEEHEEEEDEEDENEDLRVTVGGVEGAIAHGTILLAPHSPVTTTARTTSTTDASSDVEMAVRSGCSGDGHHEGKNNNDDDGGHDDGEGDASEVGSQVMGGGDHKHKNGMECVTRKRRWGWRCGVACWPRPRRKRRRHPLGGDDSASGSEDSRREKEEEGKEQWWRSVFLYYYLRCLFPTPKEFDYRWEWNPRTYALKWLALNETGKNRSVHKQNYPYPLIVIIYCWFGAFVGIAVAAIITQYGFNHIDKPLLIGSFGATAVLIYGAQQSPLAQPKNVLGGHAIAALVGVTCYKAMGSEWYSCALAVSLAIAFMLLTTTPHPPAGATALIAVTGGDVINDAGYYYVLTTLLGISIMLAVALIWNNVPRAPHMKYPRYWI